MTARDLESKTSYLEDLLQSISSNILSNALYEAAPPSKLLSDSEKYVNIAKKTAEEMKELMLLLKPEREPSIRRAVWEFTQPINNYIETLKNLPEQARNATKQSLEYLRMAVARGQELVSLAKDIAKSPSKGIVEVLRLKEVSESKEYLSKVSVPEAVYVRLEYLKSALEDLKAYISSLERTSKDLLRHIDKIKEEISRFQQS